MIRRPWVAGEADRVAEIAKFSTSIAEVESKTGRSRDSIDHAFRARGFVSLSALVGIGGDVEVVDGPVAAAPHRDVDKNIAVPIQDTQALESWLVWSDAHVPFEDKRAFDLVLKVARELRPDGQAIIGDFADMLAVSSHPKAPAQMRVQFKDEVEAVNARLDQLDALGCSKKQFFTGNHESRGQRFAVKQAIGLYDSLDPSYLFALERRGWVVHPYRQHAKIGRANLVHDIGYCGKSAAFQNGAAFESSTMQGHTHNATTTYFGNVDGDSHFSMTIGWLGSDEAAEYLAPIKSTRNWQRGFAMMWIEPATQNTHAQFIPIVQHRCVVNGRLFTN